MGIAATLPELSEWTLIYISAKVQGELKNKLQINLVLDLLT